MSLAPWRTADRCRDEAISALELEPGQRVVDVGCGGGVAFEALQRQVGDTGWVVGIDTDPDALGDAAALVAENRWRNVRTVQLPAAECVWDASADAALFAYTGDLILDPASVLNVLRQLRPRARVACVDRVRVLTAHRGQPLELLTTYLGGFTVRPVGTRGYYVAYGYVPPNEIRPG